MAALKGLVMVMAVLIVVTAGAIGYGLYMKSSDPNFTFFGSGTPEAASGPTPPSMIGPSALSFGEVGIVLPRGCAIADMKPQGALLYVRLGGGDGCQRVVVVDTERGAVRGSVVLGVQP